MPFPRQTVASHLLRQLFPPFCALPIRVDHSIKVSVIEWTSLAYIESKPYHWWLIRKKNATKYIFFQKKKKRDFLKIAERNKETERETGAEIQRRSSNEAVQVFFCKLRVKEGEGKNVARAEKIFCTRRCTRRTLPLNPSTPFHLKPHTIACWAAIFLVPRNAAWSSPSVSRRV